MLYLDRANADICAMSAIWLGALSGPRKLRKTTLTMSGYFTSRVNFKPKTNIIVANAGTPIAEVSPKLVRALRKAVEYFLEPC
jgi:hypothetical protein